LLRIGQQIGPYILINRLGCGAFGEVWLAERRTQIATTKVALKIPLDTHVDIDLVKQEAGLWVQASGHPNVLPIIEADVYGGQVVIVSEYAPEGSLSEWLINHGGSAPSVASAVEIAAGILPGLQHLHEKRIVHRDLKPPNILLQGHTPRLADFGISRVLSSSRSGTIAGSPHYMAPEAFDGERNEQTDIWSTGVILYQLLSGQLPFPQKDATALMGAILSHEPRLLPDSVPACLQTLTMTSLDKNPAKRYRTAAEMRLALRAAERSIVSPGAYAPTIANGENIVIGPSTTTATLEWPPETKNRNAEPTKRLWTTLKEVMGLVKQESSLKAAEPIHKWSRVKTWLGDYKSGPNAKVFDGKSLAAFYGPYGQYDGPPRFRIDWQKEGEKKKDVEECRLYLWHAPTGAQLSSLLFDSDKFPQGRLPSKGAFSQDAKRFAFAVGGLDQGMVRIWDTHTGRTAREIKIVADGFLTSLAFSPTGRYLACSCSNDKISIWDFKINSVSNSFSSHSEHISHLHFSNNEQLLAGASSEYGLRLWDWRNSQLRLSALAGKNSSCPGTFSPNSDMLATITSDHKIMIWDTNTSELLNVFDNMKFKRSFISFSPDGLTIACSSDTSKLGISLLDISSGNIIAILDEDKEVEDCICSSNENFLINWCKDKTINLWKGEGASKR